MRLFIYAAIAALGLFSGSAHARVVIDTNAPVPYATGEMRAAEVVGQESAYIYCDLTGNVVACGAGDGVSKDAYCYSDEYRYKRLFSAVGKTATVRFTWDPVSNRCTSLEITNNSSPSDVRAPGVAVYDVVADVEPAYDFAYGTMGAPSTGLHEQVACTVSAALVDCVVVDKNEVIGRCISSADSPLQTYDDMRLAALGVNETSYVFLEWDDALPIHNCTQVYVSNASFNLH